MINTSIKIASAAVLATIFAGCSMMLPYKEDFVCQKGAGEGLCGSVNEVYEETKDIDEYRAKQHLKASGSKSKKVNQPTINTQDITDRALLQEIVEAVEIRNIQNETPTIFRIQQAPAIIHAEATSAKQANVADKKPNNATAKANKRTKPKNSTAEAKNTPNKQQKSIANKIKEQNDKQASNTASLANNNIAGDKALNGVNSGAALEATALNSSEEVPFQPLERDCSDVTDNEIKFVKEVSVCANYANIRRAPYATADIVKVADKGDKLEALEEQGGWIKLKDGNYVFKDVVSTK